MWHHYSRSYNRTYITQKKTNLLLFFQERLSYIGPEEFVQAFVQKDSLDNEKVTLLFKY